MAIKLKTVFTPSAANLSFANGLVQQLDELAIKRKQWEATEYKKSTETLIGLFMSCKDVFEKQFLTASDGDKKTFRAELTARLKADGIRVQSNTTTLTMFVRFVFGSDRKRAHGYAYVLKAVISHEIKTEDMPDWIAEQGGIEEVKRLMVVSEKAIKNREALKTAQAEVIATLEQAQVAPLAKLPMSGVSGQYALLLAKPEPDGMLSIIGVLSDVEDALYNACLLKMAKRKAADTAQTQALSKESSDLLATLRKAANDQRMRLAA